MQSTHKTDPLGLTLSVAKAICAGATIRARGGAIITSKPIKLHEHIVVSDDGKVVTLVDFVQGDSGVWYSLDLPVEQVVARFEGRLSPEEWMNLSTFPNTVPVMVSPPREPEAQTV